MNNEFEKFLVEPNAVEPRQFTEEPPPSPIIISKVPSGYTPMSQIELEGQAYSGVKSGTVPWWVLAAAAIVFVVPSLGMALATGNLIVLLIVVLSLTLPMMIVLRGFRAKLTAKKHQEQRQSRREIAMRE